MPAPNFPQPPQRNFDQKCFPNDLINGDRRFCTNITLMDYSPSMQFNSMANMFAGGEYKLPLPRNITDIESIVWGENDAVSTGINIASAFGVGGSSLTQAAGGAADALSAATGKQLNPLYFMVYKRPAYKEFRFTWTLAPSTQQESDTLKDIIIKLKKAALPSQDGGMGVIMKYPQIAMISFEPSDYLFKLKPCAIQSVQVEYAPAGPSFFKNSKAPTMINLGLSLKEIQLWKSEDL